MRFSSGISAAKKLARTPQKKRNRQNRGVLPPLPTETGMSISHAEHEACGCGANPHIRGQLRAKIIAFWGGKCTPNKEAN